MKFTIDPEFVTLITVCKDYMKDRPEDEQLIAKLKGHIHTSTSSEDHPEFAKLREHLGKEGFILIERGWWNGDRVVKPFQLNEKKFKKGDQFSCAAALQWTLKN